MALIRFLVLLSIKLTARAFFSFDVSWVQPQIPDPFKGIRIGALLNHTSLFEPVYLGALPLSFLWKIASRGVFPGADKTLNRPIAGRFFKLFAPRVVTITRRRDATWDGFLDAIQGDSVILIAPEGRMKRPNGLDSEGKPMTVRGGIAEILLKVESGRMVIAHSGGLHHVQAPGEKWPRLFRRVRVRFEGIEIADYLANIRSEVGEDEKVLRLTIARDLEARRDRNTP